MPKAPYLALVNVRPHEDGTELADLLMGAIEYRRIPLTPSALRRDWHCAACATPLDRGEVAYRPLTNRSVREARLCVTCVERARRA